VDDESDCDQPHVLCVCMPPPQHTTPRTTVNTQWLLDQTRQSTLVTTHSRGVAEGGEERLIT
jgi:hypothetical protein